MKHLYLLFITLTFCLSCSKIEPVASPGDGDGHDDDPPSLEACFSLDRETSLVGETLTISNCSAGASTYNFDFGNGNGSSDDNPTVVYHEAGEYTITLTVSNEADETRSVSRSVYVSDSDAYYIYPDVPEGYSYLPLQAGIDPQSGTIYIIELREDLLGAGGSKFYYRSLDASFTATSYYIADKPFNSNSAFVNFLPNGNRNFHFSRTLADLYGSQELTYNGSWGFISNINPANKHSYGFLPVGANYLYFGTADDAGVYKAAIEHRNNMGDTFQIDLITLGSASSMLGDMIPIDTGYVAFGGEFIKNVTPPQISDYKPVLAFFDASLNLVSEKVLADSEAGGGINSPNDLNGSYHLAKLSNGNLVLYGNSELIVTDPAGEMIKHTLYADTSPVQALLVLGDTFVISTDGYLRKFDGNGNQIKALNYNGNYLPALLSVDDKLFFVAGYDTEDGVKLFYGAVDADLSLQFLGS